MLDAALGSCPAALILPSRGRKARGKAKSLPADFPGPRRYNVPAELQSSSVSVSVTAIAKPRARMMFPPAATTRGAPTTGATPIMTP